MANFSLTSLFKLTFNINVLTFWLRGKLVVQNSGFSPFTTIEVSRLAKQYWMRMAVSSEPLLSHVTYCSMLHGY